MYLAYIIWAFEVYYTSKGTLEIPLFAYDGIYNVMTLSIMYSYWPTLDLLARELSLDTIRIMSDTLNETICHVYRPWIIDYPPLF